MSDVFNPVGCTAQASSGAGADADYAGGTKHSIAGAPALVCITLATMLLCQPQLVTSVESLAGAA